MKLPVGNKELISSSEVVTEVVTDVVGSEVGVATEINRNGD